MASTFSFRECFAEFMGVLTLVFFGGWATVLIVNDKLDLLDVALVHSLSIGIFMWAGGAFCKGHFNPAISMASFAVGNIDGLKLVFYIVSQFIGSYVGALLIYYTLPETLYTEAFDNYAEIGCPRLNNTYKGFTALLMEAIGAFIITLVYACLHDQSKTPYYSLIVGLATGISYLTAGENTGPSVNPFRYLGPALLTFNLWDSYIYVIVPFLGSLAAVAAHDYIFALSEKEKTNDSRLHGSKLIKIE